VDKEVVGYLMTRHSGVKQRGIARDQDLREVLLPNVMFDSEQQRHSNVMRCLLLVKSRHEVK